MSKLGVQVLSWTPGALEYVLQSRPKHIKVLEANPTVLARIKAEIPDCFIVYRRYADLGTQQRLLANPIQGAREFASRVLGDIDAARAHVDVVEGLNETGLWESADPYSLFTAEYARMLHTESLPSIAYNFSCGTPPGYYTGDGNVHPDEFREGLRAHWAHYYDGLRESDYLGFHEYSWPQMQNSQSWLCLRYRRVWDVLPDDCRKSIFITECGIDGGVAGQPIEAAGWRAVCDEETYLSQLDWYAKEIEKDSYVIGSHIFQVSSADPRWDSFSVLGCDRIAEYIKNQRRNPMSYEFVFGFKTLHNANPDIIGDATSQQYDVPGVCSFQFTTNGMLLYKDHKVSFLEQTLPFAWAS